MKRAITIVCLAALWLSGCYSFPTKTLAAVNSTYTAKHVDEFFLAHGLPHSSYTLADGDILYEWDSGVRSMRMPSSTTTTGSIDGGGSFRAHSTSHGGGTLRMSCALRIQTSPDGMVKNIVLDKDTIGMWETSRFAELFSEYKDDPAADGP